MSRPELTGHASLYYNEREARKYHSSSRMVGVQREITERAVELLRLDDCCADGDNEGQPRLVLDVGCGSGLSGQVLEEKGHVWIGCDISRDMLTVAKERMVVDRAAPDNDKVKEEAAMKIDKEDDDDSDGEDEGRTRNSTGDLLHHDMGTGLPFRPATFDACISISALQWLCYSNTAKQNPRRRLTRFFSSLYSVLKRGGRAVLQFYPETPEQAVLITETATRVGFAGGVVVDYPNSAKAKKHYLVLTFDRSSSQRKKAAATAATAAAAAGAGGKRQQHVAVAASAAGGGGGNNGRGKNGGKASEAIPRKKKGGIKTKEWIMHKKDMQRRKGKDVRPDTKYTARKRPTKF